MSAISAAPIVVEIDAPNIEVYAISDLHAEPDSNKLWSFKKCNPRNIENTFTVLIVAGDIGSNIDRIEMILRNLVSKFDLVAYTFGNHEAWCSPSNANSFEKLNLVMEVARKCGVVTSPIKLLRRCGAPALFIVPLFSWYHSGFDAEPDVSFVRDANRFSDRWSDFWLCKWPVDVVLHEEFVNIVTDSAKLSLYFDQLNEHIGTTVKRSEGENESAFTVAENDIVITFSHFVPRQELTPEKRFLFEPQLMKVIGSNLLEERIRSIRPHVHLFGHTHIPIDITIDGIRYVQWPLGYAREHSQQCKAVFEHGPLLLTRLCGNEVTQSPDKASENVFWSEYYKETPRDPQNVEPASWVRERNETSVGCQQGYVN